MNPRAPYLFTEGHSYLFTVTGMITLPPDEEEFVVLKSQFDSRHLLKYLPYKDYGLVTDKVVNCRIDKISCSGKMYLEPEHKDYKEGNFYDFPVEGFEEILNSEEKAEHFLRLTDVNGNTVFVNIGEHNPRDFSASVLCRVDRIKKGKLYLSLSETIVPHSRLETGKTYEFAVNELVTLAEDEEYYVLRDEYDETHYLRCKHFEEYNINKDGIIRCRVLGKPQLFRHYLEPEHPFYKIGGEYDFFVKSEESYTNEFGNVVSNLLVTDGSEREYFASRDDSYGQRPLPGSVVKCRVDDIRVSKLLLSCF